MCCGASLHHRCGSSYKFMAEMAEKGNIPKRWDEAKERDLQRVMILHGPFASEPGANMAIVENESWAKLAPLLERLRQHCLAMWGVEPAANGKPAQSEPRAGKRRAAAEG
jgi:hypothetical protein